MFFSAVEATEGCFPQQCISGTLRIDVIVFNVLYDNTDYMLELSVQEGSNVQTD